MDRHFIAEIVVASLGFLLITVNGALGFLPLPWLGIWLVIGAGSWHWYRVRKKAQKEGKEVLT